MSRDFHDASRIDPAEVDAALATFDSREGSTYGGQPVECYRFQKGADLYLWTSADETVVLPQGTFTPITIERSALDHSKEDHAGSLEVRVALDNPLVAAHVAYVPPDPVMLSVYRAHRGDEANATLVFYGTVISTAVAGSECSLTCAPFNQSLARDVPLLCYQSQCNWALYGRGCGVDALTFQTNATISSVSGLTVVSGDFASKPDGWFRNGWLRSPDGDVRFIVAHTGNTVTLMNAFPGLALGDVVAAFAGCDRTETMCAAKFNNLPNHLGFPRVPNRNPFDGSVT